MLDTRARHEFIRQRQQPWAPLRTRIRLAGLQSYSMNAVSPWRNGKPAPRHNWQSATNLNTPYKSCSLAGAKKDIAVETAVYDQKIAELGTVLRALPPTNHNSKSLFFCAEQLRPSRARHQNLCRPRRPFKKIAKEETDDRRLLLRHCILLRRRPSETSSSCSPRSHQSPSSCE